MALDDNARAVIASNARHAITELEGLVLLGNGESLEHEAWDRYEAAMSRLVYIAEQLDDADVPRSD